MSSCSFELRMPAVVRCTSTRQLECAPVCLEIFLIQVLPYSADQIVWTCPSAYMILFASSIRCSIASASASSTAGRIVWFACAITAARDCPSTFACASER